MLEAMQHGDNAFLTLTFRDPEIGPPVVSVYKKHVQDFLKRLRKELEPIRIRYYAVGEYGDESHRPHYHLAIFGMPTCSYGRTRDRTVMLGRSCCPSCDLVSRAWGFGHVFLGTLEDDSAQYIAGYVTKKMTKKDDPRLNGRRPEFALMSTQPGLGFSAMHEVASTFMQFNLDVTEGDVPSTLRHGKRLLPLGRYLRQKLRLMVGKDEKAPQYTIDKANEKMLPLRQAARASSDNPSLKGQITEKQKGKIASLEAREKIHKQRKHL